MPHHGPPRPTLLLVDNHSDFLQRWRSASERAGDFSFVQRNSYDAAMNALSDSNVDILVTDLFLSEESEDREEPSEAEGLHLIERCRALHPKSRIVAITGKSGVGTEIGARALEAGADDFISSAWTFIDTDALLEQKLRIFRKLLTELVSK